MRSKIISGSANTVSNSLVNYAPIFKSAAGWNAAETNQFTVIPMNGTLSNFRVVLDSAPGVGKSYTITLRKNGVDTASTVTISGTGTTAAVAARVSVVTGDLMSISTTPTGAPVAVAVSFTLDFKGATPKKSTLLSTSSLTASGILYTPVQGFQTSGGSSPVNETLVSVNGVISNMIVKLGAALASSTRTITLRKNGVSTGLTITINAGETTASDSVNSVSVVPGDRLVWITGGGSVAVGGLFVSAVFTATTEGEGVLSCGSSNAPSVSATNYSTIGGVAENSWVASEAVARQVTNAVRFKRLQILLGTAPGAGNSWTFNLRVNGAAVGLQVIISDTATTGSVDGDVSVTAGSLVAIESVPASTPTSAGRTQWALTTFQLNDGGKNQAVLIH